MSILLSYPTELKDITFQMALDETILEYAVQMRSLAVHLRFYRAYPSISIGFSQRHSEMIQLLSHSGRPWVRRITGGGLVEHQNDLIFSICTPIQMNPIFSSPSVSYRAIHEWLKQSMLAVGIQADWRRPCQAEVRKPDHMVCFTHPICDDLLVNGRKVAGGAQKRTRGYLLHQGSIQLYQHSQISQLTHEQTTRMIKQFQDEMCHSLELSVSEHNMDEALKGQAELLEQQKYKSIEWNHKGRYVVESHQLQTVFL